ncbi:Uncharacterised protein [Delftia tsuruhatensis]|nr:Uncharacterised protein [Delftia tsuruhatensis]CAC9680924.1 Uncharacterised protein [Delftia tsuruhatensis]
MRGADTGLRPQFISTVQGPGHATALHDADTDALELSTTALSWQLPRRLMLLFRLWSRRKSCHS